VVMARKPAAIRPGLIGWWSARRCEAIVPGGELPPHDAGPPARRPQPLRPRPGPVVGRLWGPETKRSMAAPALAHPIRSDVKGT